MKKAIPFESEFILHMITQNRLKELFDLELVASEIQLDGQRLDNLAFDAKAKSFVIIEYKNKFDANVLKQCLDYYDLVLNNPDIFLKRLNDVEKVDFKNTRVMIIGPEFSDDQIMNAENNFELWKVTLFDGCEATWENLKTGESKTLNIPPDELKLSEETLLENKTEEIKDLYFNFKKRVLSEFDDLEIRFLVDAFSLKTGNELICVAVFLKSSLNIYIYGDGLKNTDRLADISHKSTGGNANYLLSYRSDDDLDYTMDLIREVYNQRRVKK